MENADSLSLDQAQALGRPRLRLTRWSWLDGLFVLLALGAIKRTFHDSQLNDEDFHVYWKAASVWLAGGNPYAYTAADQGFVFKYPPWLLPLFLPVGLLSYETARLVWYAVQLFCVGYAVRWCVRQGVARRLAISVAFIFWWMFHAHFSAGQFTLVILTVALWTHPRAKNPESRGTGLREAFLTYILSAKVFSLYTLAGIWRNFLKIGPWLWGAGLFVTCHLLLLAVSIKNGAVDPSLQGIAHSLIQTYRDFMVAATSGGAELGAIIVRGQGNHGLTALVLRTLDVNSLSFASDMITSASLMLLFGTLWQRFSRGLNEAERWAGWIALALIVHPLAWHHSFVLAYPLCALSLSRASATRRKGLILLSLLGACCIGIFIPQVLGKTLVKPIELAGVKSWGVVIAGVALILSSRAASQEATR